MFKCDVCNRNATLPLLMMLRVSDWKWALQRTHLKASVPRIRAVNFLVPGKVEILDFSLAC